MLKKFSWDYLNAHQDEIVCAIKSFSGKEFLQVDYDETSGDTTGATIWITPKEQYQSALEAYTALWMKDTSYWEQWDYDWQNEEISQIMLGHLLRESKEFEFKLLSGCELYHETIEFMTNVRDSIAHKLINYEPRSHRFGIFVNEDRLDDQEVGSFILPIQGELISGLGLKMDWNDRLIFVETTKEFIYMSWGTSG